MDEMNQNFKRDVRRVREEGAELTGINSLHSGSHGVTGSTPGRRFAPSLPPGC